MVMSDWRARFPGGTDISTTLRHYLQSVESILRCALRSGVAGSLDDNDENAPTPSPLSSGDLAQVHARVASTLAFFRGFLCTSLWREPSLYICLGLSNIVPLLVDLARASRPAARMLVTPALADALSNVWSAVAEGTSVNGVDPERLRRVQAYVDWTGEVLEALKAELGGYPLDQGE